MDGYKEEFFDRLESAIRYGDKTANAEGRYPYIPANDQALANSLEVVKKILEHLKITREGCIPPSTKKGPTKLPTFLDAGCGIGRKVHVAWRKLFSAKGIEICDASIKIARMVLGTKAIIKADLLKYTKYDQFNVIYLYMPMVNSDLQDEFEERLVNLSQKNVIVISAGDRGFKGKLHNLQNSKFFSTMVKRLSIRESGYKILVKPALYEQLKRDFQPCKTCKF